MRESVEAIIHRTAEEAEETPVFAPPAAGRELRAAEEMLCLELPEMLRDFYREFNGVGVVDQEEGDDVAWWIVPVGKIAAMTEKVELWMKGDAAQFRSGGIFFGDWGNGDAFGFLKDENGAITDATIHQWDHELLECSDTGLSLNEFLSVLAESA